jgi:hypothetical protein
MNKKIVIINGGALSGKDEFVKCCSRHISCKNKSTVDKVKEAYKLMGWDEEKTEAHRKALSDIKDIGTKNLDHPFNYISEEIKKFELDNNEIMFIHSREPEEIVRFAEGFGAITLLIENDNVPKITSNHADANVDGIVYQYTVMNNGTINELEDKAIKFLGAINAI